MKHTDVLIVGAGPAGSVCGYLLKKAGIDCLLMDHATFPRDKICGGGLTPKAWHLLDRLLPGIRYDFNPVYHIRIDIGMKANCEFDVDEPIRIVQRKVFDHKLLQEYVNAVVFRDVIERHEVSSVPALRYTLDYVVHNYARKISTRAISGTLKAIGISDNREYISNYLRYLADAYLIYPVSLRTDSVSVRRTNPDKYYMVDTGVVRAMTPKNDAEKGWLLENLVFLHFRRGNNKIEYYINRDGGEVDFLVTNLDTKSRRLVQVAWDMEQLDTFKREINAIRLAKEEIKVKNCCVVTWNSETVLEDGINVIPIWKFCLE